MKSQALASWQAAPIWPVVTSHGSPTVMFSATDP